MRREVGVCVRGWLNYGGEMGGCCVLFRMRWRLPFPSGGGGGRIEAVMRVLELWLGAY